MEQITLFSGSSEIRIDKKIRLIELFAGIGSQAKALKNIGADFEHYKICEFDKYAVTSYNAIHGTDFKVSDITKWHAADLGIIEKDKYEYIVTYSFPCQSLSVAGKGEGMAKGSGTRSGLLWEVERLLEECGDNLPQILLMENVDAILFKKNRKHFFQWCNRLEKFGYRNYYQVLNAKDYGIPQNRKRCYMVSILGDYYYEFPKPIKLELRVKDLLEKEVPEKYYISKALVEFFMKNTIKQKEKGNGFTFNPTDGNCVGKAITSKAGSRMDDNFIIDDITCQPCLTPDRIEKRQNGRRFKEDNEPMFTLTAQDIHGVLISNSEIKQPCEIRRDKGIVTYKDNVMGALRTINQCGDKHLICYNQYRPDGVQTSLNDRIYDSGGVGLSVTTSPFFMPNYLNNYRIRKLMPIEGFSLMGFAREDFFKVKKAGISDSQCYKQAGNSIVVNVLEAIFRNMNMKGVKRWQK